LGEGLAPIPERLLLAHSRGEVLFVAGAGVSMPALPSFRGLVLQVYEQLDKPMFDHLSRIPVDACNRWPMNFAVSEQQLAEARRFLAGDYDVVLGMLERRMDTDGSGASKVRSVIQSKIASVKDPLSLHQTLMKLARRQEKTAIVTTNFDLLFESAARKARSAIRTQSLGAIARPSRASLHGVLHIHGALDIDQDEPAELIVSDRDFGEHYFRRRIVPDFIYDAARLFNIVLVGYSANDPPMRYLLNAIAADGSRFDDLKERFTFVGASAPDPVGIQDWRARGITPIHYDVIDGSHSRLNESLTRWATLSVHNGTAKAVSTEVRRIVKNRRADALDRDRDLFDHLFRRAGTQERLQLATLVRSSASFDWAEAMMEIALEDPRGVGP
jgi:hypothetical protein